MQMMKRWILKDGATSLDGLVLEEVPIPEPGPGQVRVRIRAVSLNFRDQLALTNAGDGWRVPGDLVPISDGAGEIDALGEGVTQWAVGDKVVTVYLKDFPHWPPHAGIGLGPGALDQQGMLADYVVLSAEQVTRAPATLSFAEAATLPCAALTAWTALQQAHPVRPGQKVLSLGTGSVSLFALAFARALGAAAYVTTSNDDKRARLIELGAAGVFNYRTDADWGKTVFASTGGVDKVVNTAGFGSINQSVQALAFGGDVGVIGLFDFGDAIDPFPFLSKGASLHGIPVGPRDAQEEMIRFIDRHGIKPVIDRVFPFADARAAYEAQNNPALFGKIVIDLA
jgi:NADPH:quinone reductase-like Zn-dependent oxidoreductase